MDDYETQLTTFALGRLRMAHDLRQVGLPLEAKVYDREARRALCEVLGVGYDRTREELFFHRVTE